jgi:hypothetical protein
MPDKTINSKDFQAILQLNLLDVVGLSDKSEEEKTKYLQKFNELAWTLFFQADGKNLPEEELEKVGKLLKGKKFEEANDYLEENFPNLREKIATHTLLAKKLLIIEILDYEITLIKARAKAKVGKDNSEIFIKLQELVYNDKWADFKKLFMSIKKDE